MRSGCDPVHLECVDTVVDSEGNVAIPNMTTARTPANTKLASVTEIRSIIVFTPFPLRESRTHSNRLDLVRITVASCDGPLNGVRRLCDIEPFTNDPHYLHFLPENPHRAHLDPDTPTSKHIGLYWLSIRI